MTADEMKRALSPETEIWRAYVETAENNIQRRLETNRYYHTVISALFIAYGYLAKGGLGEAAPGQPLHGATMSQMAVMLGLPMLLIIVCMAWFVQLRNFRMISGAKFGVIGELEAQLVSKPFTLEHQRLHRRMLMRGSTVDQVVPALFLAIGWAALIYPIYGPVLEFAGRFGK
jgi:hypothetical protein